MGELHAQAQWILPAAAALFVTLAVLARFDALPWDRPITQWIDDNTYVAVAAKDNLYTESLALLECSIPDGRCTPESDSIGSLGELVFPLGGSVTDR